MSVRAVVALVGAKFRERDARDAYSVCGLGDLESR